MKNKIASNLKVIQNLTAENFAHLIGVGASVQTTTKTNKKKEELAKLGWFLDIEQISAVFNLLFNELYTYGISSTDVLSLTDLTLEELYANANPEPVKNRLFFEFENFQQGLITKAEFKSYLSENLEKLDYPTLDLFLCILDRDWGVGISSSTVNSVFGNIVPVFSVTRATDLKLEEAEFEDKVIYFIETKYDGTRDFLIVPPDAKKEDIYLMSRNARRLLVPEAIEDIWSYVKSYKHTGFVLDGELTMKDSVLSDERTSITGIHNSAIAESAGKNSKLEEGWSQNVSFNAFDYLTYDEFFMQLDTPALEERKLTLIQLLEHIPRKNCIRLGDFTLCNGELVMQMATEFYTNILSQGGEGIIIKDSRYAYSFDKPNSGWFKVKPVNTCELRVIGIQESDDPELPEGSMGALICQTECETITVEVGSGFNDSERLRKDWIGKIIEVRYFGVTHANGVNNSSLFLPRVMKDEDRKAIESKTGVEYSVIRLDKTEADYAKDLVGYRA
jgi:hypothetical protein